MCPVHIVRAVLVQEHTFDTVTHTEGWAHLAHDNTCQLII